MVYGELENKLSKLHWFDLWYIGALIAVIKLSEPKALIL